MSEPIVVNAIIESADVTLDRGAFLSVWLMLRYDGMGQGFGGVVLGGTPDAAAGDHKNQPNIAGEWLVWCLRVADVERLRDCVGKAIRVRKTDKFGDIIAIGHIVKDIWFEPKKAMESLGIQK